MGMFSWTCAVSGKSILIDDYAEGTGRDHCFLVTPDRTYEEESYEGYGEFDGVDVYDLIGEGDRHKGIDDHFAGKGSFDIKIVLAENYFGQTYEELGASEGCPYQGGIMGDDLGNDEEDEEDE